MTRDGAEWARLDALLEAALDLPQAERRQWLDRACAGDPDTRAALERLLKHAEADTGPIQPGAALESSAHAPSSSGDGALAPGGRLGRYEIVSLLGSGGMGHVYRAVDPSLGREVAIKAVSGALHGDAASLRRFEREARVLAALNHPGIATIYGFEQLGGVPYLVLELVAGETLGDRLAKGRLPVAEAVAIARQVAEALEEAHRQGVVHRDLKPSNVMLTPEGRVKLLDFGLAKSPEPGISDQARTLTGVIVGTAPYMSPEQVRAEVVDERADVWAFGCVSYEMLTGRRAFAASQVPDILASVLRDEPDWAALPSETPPALRRLLERCLRKVPRERLQAMGDARLELSELEAASPNAARDDARMRRRVVAVVGLAVVGLLIVALTVRRPSPPPRVLQLSLDLPPQLALDERFAAPFALSPDGARLALVAVEDGRSRLFVREIDEITPRRVGGVDSAWQPFFSPDGRSIAYFDDGKLFRVPVEGGRPVLITAVTVNPRGASWAPDGTIVLAPSQTSGLVRVADGGGAVRPLTELTASRGEETHRWPQVLPDGRHVLFTVVEQDASFDDGELQVASLATGERRTVLKGAAWGRWVESGHLLFARHGRLHAVPFDLERLQAGGAPVVVVDGVRYDVRNGGTHADLAGDAIVYQPARPSLPERHIVGLDAAGAISRFTERPRVFRAPRASPDGSRLAVVIGTGAATDLWLVDPGSTLTRVTSGLGPLLPLWRPDGRALTVSARAGDRWRLLDVSPDGGPPRVRHESAHRLYANGWTPDGRRLVFQQYHPDHGWDLWSVAEGGRPEPLLATPSHEARAAVSRDGHWIAYESDELDGLVEIYVRSFPDGERKLRLTTSGARLPRWGAPGELFYWRTDGPGSLQKVRWRAEGDRFVVLEDAPYWPESESTRAARSILVVMNDASYDVDAAGRVVMLEPVAPRDAAPLARPVVVFGWAQELRRRMASTP